MTNIYRNNKTYVHIQKLNNNVKNHLIELTNITID